MTARATTSIADAAAAALAIALGAHEADLLDRRAGHHSSTASSSPICTSPDLERAAATHRRHARKRTRSDRALAGGVGRVHVIDGRTPHSVIAELFTDRGVGTLVTP